MNKTPSQHQRNHCKLFGCSGGESGTLSTQYFMWGGALLTSTESIVWQWEEYSNHLLNPTNAFQEGGSCALSSLGSTSLGLSMVVDGLLIMSLLFADDVVLVASSNIELQWDSLQPSVKRQG